MMRWKRIAQKRVRDNMIQREKYPAVTCCWNSGWKGGLKRWEHICSAQGESKGAHLSTLGEGGGDLSMKSSYRVACHWRICGGCWRGWEDNVMTERYIIAWCSQRRSHWTTMFTPFGSQVAGQTSKDECCHWAWKFVWKKNKNLPTQWIWILSCSWADYWCCWIWKQRIKPLAK